MNIIESIFIVLLIVAMGTIYRYQKTSNWPTNRLIRAVRRRASKPANDNVRQSFVYQVERRRPRKW
jgi:hypothetical protein